MSTEVFILKNALDVLKKGLAALGDRESERRRKEFIATAIAELLKLHPDLTAAEAKIAAAKVAGAPPSPELLRAQAMLRSARSYTRRAKEKKEKVPKRAKRKAAKKKVTKQK